MAGTQKNNFLGNKKMNYDIIGDIHGQAEKLIKLLEKLGYKKQNNIYQQEERQVVFVGDFIDRGKHQQQVIDIVRPMIENNKAVVVMGNHEFNAICYHTKTTEIPSGYLRNHKEKNTKQHAAFLHEYPVGDDKTEELIQWFKTLPLFLELDGFRVVHACWDQHIIDKLTPKLTQDNCLMEEYYLDASLEGNDVYEFVEVLLKGKEISLPDGISFHDKDGNERHEIRIKWWEQSLKTYQQASVLNIPGLNNSPDINIPQKDMNKGYPSDDKPVFFGHYWFTGTPTAISNNVACLDYSAAKEGPLVAYRWDKQNTQHISNNAFMQSD